MNRKEEVTFILKMFVLSRKFELTNVPNANNQTPLNIAVQCCNEEFVTYLLHCRANPTKQDGQGRTALHMAVVCASPLSIIEQLVKDQSKSFLDLEDYGKYLESFNYHIDEFNFLVRGLQCFEFGGRKTQYERSENAFITRFRH